jgi:hypothetical protein
MQKTIDIHGMKVKVDGESDSAQYGAHYLGNLQSDEAKAFFDEAKRDHNNGLAHFEVPHTGENAALTHHFTLVHNNDGTYNLRKRNGY